MNKRSKTEFGEFLVGEIKKAKMSQEEFYNAIEIKKPYFYDLLTKTPPPPELQDKILLVLEKNSTKNIKRRSELYDLAAKGRNELPKDIFDFLNGNIEEISRIRRIIK